jgi:acyl dehydratase
MAIDYERLMAWKFEDSSQVYTKRDTILYGLGLGLGERPTDPDDLRFVYERGLEVLPTFATTLAGPRTWWVDTGQIDAGKVVHGEQSLHIHQLPDPEGHVIGKTRVTGIVDKGEGRGALLYTERTLFDASSGAVLATLGSTSFARADGGFGGPSGPLKPVHPLPKRPADAQFVMRTLPQSALIYRLSGDYNALHADPYVAAAAGFKQPILQGLCTFGIAGLAILKLGCGGDVARFSNMTGRFSGSVYPGETLRTDLWLDNEIVSFRTVVVERDAVALNNGRAEIRPA